MRPKTYILRILVQAGLYKLFELLGEISRQLRRIVLRDQEQDSHRMEVGVRWFSFSEFYSSDPQRPNISLGIVGWKYQYSGGTPNSQ